MGFCKKFWTLIVLVLCLSADTFDLISDWIFYYDLVSAEDGLVFGVFDHTVITATLVFCIIGSVAFLVETCLNLWEYRSGDKRVEVVALVVSLITLVIEDIPQISINVYTALCREEATNTIQIVKASTAMFEVVVKMTFIIVQVCKRIREKKTLKTLRNLSHLITFFLLILILALSIVVFVFTTNLKAKIKFDSEGLGEEESDKYLRGVSIFARINSTHPQLPHMNNNQWIQLTDIQTVTRYESIPFIVMYTRLPIEHVWVRRNDEPGLDKSLSCFKIESSHMTLAPPETCFDVFTRNKNSTVLSVRLSYVKPTTHQPLGDLHYNLEIYQQGCENVADSYQAVSLRYFKVKSDNTKTVALARIPDNRDHYRYFTTPDDIINVREYWKTGKGKCDSTAREAPKLDTKIGVSCILF